jgi:hypothetical protein
MAALVMRAHADVRTALAADKLGGRWDAVRW